MAESNGRSLCHKISRSPVVRSLRRTAHLPYLLFFASSFLLVCVCVRKLAYPGPLPAAPELPDRAPEVTKLVKKSDAKDLILITGYQRSGSSLIGDLIQQSAGTQYFFEPLHSVIGGPENHPNEPMSRISGLLHRFINCSFPHQAGYTQWMKATPWNVAKMRLLLLRCKRIKHLCYDPNVIRSVCLNADRRVIKSFFVPMRRVPDFLQTLDPGVRSRVKVLYLVRDPRAMINSLRGRPWCTSACQDAGRLCDNMHQDVKAFFRVKKELGKRLTLLRYEDMNRFPNRVSRQLFTRLGLPFTPAIAKYVAQHINVKKGNARVNDLDRFQGRQQALTGWIRHLSREDVETIQSSCDYPMDVLSYYRQSPSLFPIVNKTISLAKILGRVSQKTKQGPYFLL